MIEAREAAGNDIAPYPCCRGGSPGFVFEPKSLYVPIMKWTIEVLCHQIGYVCEVGLLGLNLLLVLVAHCVRHYLSLEAEQLTGDLETMKLTFDFHGQNFAPRYHVELTLPPRAVVAATAAVVRELGKDELNIVLHVHVSSRH